MLEVRERMEQYRKDNRITLETMSRMTGVSSGLLAFIEGGYVTHPDIARKVQKGYHLTDEETELLMPEIHRKSSPLYEPDKYRAPVDRYPSVIPFHVKKEIVLYIQEHDKKKKEV